MVNVDLIIHHAAQLITCAGRGSPKRGQDMADVGLIYDGALAVTDGKIVAVGSSADLLADFTGRETIDAGGKVVCPGFVDPHTHVIYAGDRIDEFELRLRGATYMNIMQAGGGIVSTMQATRSALLTQLVAESRQRLNVMLALGATTVEVKTGYGLDTAGELKMLQAFAALAASHPLDLVPTFLGAHALPPEYKGRADEYVDLVIEEMLPAVVEWYHSSPVSRRFLPLFCDVFCEANTFGREQARRVLEAGLALGLPAKIHADEFTNLGGVSLAVELGAVSVDHLDVTPPAEIEMLAHSKTIGVILPVVNFNLGSTHFAGARAMIDAGAALALATDINPGSAPCPSLPLVMALACRYQKLLPAEAINAVTINAAYAVGLGDQLGSLEIGKQADILIIDAPDYRHLAYQLGGNLVERVIKQGRLI